MNKIKSRVLSLLLVMILAFSWAVPFSLAEKAQTEEEQTSQSEQSEQKSETNSLDEEEAEEESENADSSLGFSPFVIDQTFEVGGVNYIVTSEDETSKTGEVSVADNTGKTIDNLSITSSVVFGEFTYAVTAISEYAFNYNVNLTGKLVIPGSVKTIGNYAFNSTGISDLEFNEGLESIGKNGISDNRNLNTHIYFPDSLINLGDSSFYLSNITGVTFGSGLKKIGDRTFFKCFSLTGEVVLPPLLENLPEYMFFECNLTSIKFNEGLKTIGRAAFNYCENLVGTIKFPDSLISVEEYAFHKTGITGLELNPSLQNIGTKAFYNTSNLTGKVVIPEGITSVPEKLFNTSAITEVVFTRRDGGFELTDTSFDYDEINFSIPKNSEINYRTILSGFGVTDANIIEFDDREAKIRSFSVNGVEAIIIDHDTGIIAVYLPAGVDIRALTPQITFDGESLTPQGGVTQDFSSIVDYDVTMMDGFITNRYRAIVYSKPIFTDQPQDVGIEYGENASFEVEATSFAPQYRWYYFDTTINDFKMFDTNPTWQNKKLEVENATRGMTFKCEVYNGIASEFSDPVSLSVLPIRYNVLEGFGEYTGVGDLVARVDAPFDEFQTLKINGEEIALENYDIAGGSTIITLKEGFLRSLSNGTHVVEAGFDTGIAQLDLKINVNNNPNVPKDPQLPKDEESVNNSVSGNSASTGDKNFIWVFAIVGAIALAGVITVVILKKKNKDK